MFFDDGMHGVTSNIYIKPVSGTFHLLPWAARGKFRVGEVLCEPEWDDGTPHLIDPRYVARQQVERLQELGFTLKSGWEEEFCIYDRSTGDPLFKEDNYVSHLLMAEDDEFFYTLHNHLSASDIQISSFANEYAPGQYELVSHPVDGMDGADMAFRFKQATKEICLKNGKQASFMTLLKPGQLSSGRHYSMSLWTGQGNNAYGDVTKENGLSDTAIWWLGGVLRHARAISALCCPTVNCYRRLHRAWCPSTCAWGMDDREGTLLRVKSSGKSGPYIECRLPSSACNAYLVVAGVVAAGMDGIKNKITPPTSKKQDCEKLPSSLEEALGALESNDVITEALGQTFVTWFCKCKREMEMKELEGCGPGNDSEEAFEKERKQYFVYV